MHNPTQKFRQGSIVFERSGIVFHKLKTLTSSNYLILFVETCTFPTYQCVQKGFKICFILFRSWVIYQNKNRLGFYLRTETRFINSSRSKQNKNNLNTLLETLVSRKDVQNFSRKYYTLAGSHQSFEFSKQITRFLGNKRALSKFK